MGDRNLPQSVEQFYRAPIVRYLIVGAGTNSALLAIYAGVTFFGVNEIAASSAVYAIGIVVTYILNKGWSFRDQSAHHTAFIKYIVAYGAGYVVQIAVLSGLAFQLGLPHFIAQLVAMIAAAVSIFFLLKLFVFRPAADGTNR